MADEVTVGSLESQARGAGARKSSGKPELWQFPWWVLPEYINDSALLGFSAAADRRKAALDALSYMSDWQRGRCYSLSNAFVDGLGGLATALGHELASIRTLVEVVAVLSFGAKKYAVANWCKGMPWSVCFTSAMSHLTKIIAGEDTDEESGLAHEAHFLCNVVFLLAYRDLYPEGDDRLLMFRPGGVAA